MTKTQMRDQLKDRLHALTADQRQCKSEAACRRLIASPLFRKAETVMLFLSLPEEIDTAVALEAAWRAGKIVAVPRISWSDRRMEAVALSSWQDALEERPGGLRWPRRGESLPPETLDLVVTPGLGFDGQGGRLGRGAAFYDRFFHDRTLRARRCGLAFEEQIVPRVPTTEHDQPVHCVITDERVLGPDAGKGD